MEFQNIDALLEKYWNCETSVNEEQILQDFFMQAQIPEGFKDLALLFKYTHNKQTEKLGANFDKKFNDAIKKRRKKYISIKLFAPTLKIASMIAFIITIGLSGVIWVNSTKKQNFAETYSDPFAAYKEATSALDKLSMALQKGDKLSMETLIQLNQLDVDWDRIDSINNIVYNNNIQADNEEQIIQ